MKWVKFDFIMLYITDTTTTLAPTTRPTTTTRQPGRFLYNAENARLENVRLDNNL